MLGSTMAERARFFLPLSLPLWLPHWKLRKTGRKAEHREGSLLLSVPVTCLFLSNPFPALFPLTFVQQMADYCKLQLPVSLASG